MPGNRTPWHLNFVQQGLIFVASHYGTFFIDCPSSDNNMRWILDFFFENLCTPDNSVRVHC